MSSALSVRGLSAGYGPLQVLDSIDLDVAERERVGLVGLNGHGKSTLMRAVVGLVDWRSGRDRVRRPRHHEDRDAPAGARGHRPDPAGRLAVPGPVGARQPRRRRIRARQLAQARREPRTGRGDLPAPRRAHEAGRGHALGRRAPHVLDRARPHGRGAHLPRRRAVARPRAGPRRDDRAHALQSRPGRRRTRAGRAEPHAPGGPHRPHRPHPRRQGRRHRARNPRRRSPRDRRPHHHGLPGVRLRARGARALAHVGGPRLPQPRARRHLLRRRGRRLRGLGAHRRQRARRAARGHRVRSDRRPPDLPRRVPAARRPAQLRPAHADRHARDRAHRREPDPRPVRPAAAGLPRSLRLAADVQHRRDERDERPGGRRARGDRARDARSWRCSAAPASASACAR